MRREPGRLRGFAGVAYEHAIRTRRSSAMGLRRRMAFSAPLPDSAKESAADQSEPPSDSCPPVVNGDVELFFDCDKTCCASDPGCYQTETEAGVAPQCSTAACGGGGVVTGQGSFVVRTPERPGTDPACTAACPSDGYVYGLRFDIGLSATWLLVEVGPPWEIVWGSSTPFCTDSTSLVSTTGCAAVAKAGSPTVYVMTKDPNAPARNITFIAAFTQPSCPTDGGM